MRINQRQKNQSINWKFGAALLVLLSLLIGSLFHIINKKSATHHASIPPSDSELSHISFSPEVLELQINKENYQRIRQKRERALEAGLLFTSKADLVPADMRIDKNVFPIDIRLKGDLLDHIRGDKWSYRIQLKQDELWRGMSVFSIQNSAARSHLAEWYMHQLFRLEGLMSTQYDFVEVQENGQGKGVYAYEEHFTDDLLVAHKKPIGPILKHNDDAYWNNVQKDVKPFHWTKAAEIELFNTNHNGDAEFMESFEYAKSMLHGFLNADYAASEVFDIDKMAKYYALMELSHGFHSQQITNIRFYYNPLSAKLEPIAFDCFGVELPTVTEDWAAAGEGINPKVKPLEGYPYGGVYMHKLFQDKLFFARYMSYLSQFTKADYLTQRFKLLEPYVKERESFIQQDDEYKAYQFSVENVFRKAGFTRKKIEPLPDYSLKVMTRNHSTQNLVVQSFHYFPMELIGFGTKGQLLDTLARRVFLEAYNIDTTQELYELRNTQDYDQLFYTVLGIDTFFVAPIRINNVPDVQFKADDSSLSRIQDSHSILIEADVLSFTEDQINIDEPLIIPSGITVSFKAGQRIRFLNAGCLISKSPIRAKGTSEKPIEFIGQAKAGQAILLTDNVQGSSVFEHCKFKSLSSMSYRGLYSKAGLTLSQEVTLKNCQFDNMQGEAAISLIHATMEIDNVQFNDCLGHAFTCMYTKGSLKALRLASIGGDGILAQYSSLVIEDSHFESIHGEAIVALGMNKLELAKIDILHSFEGISVLQTDTVFMDDVSLTNLQNGIQVEGSQDQVSFVMCQNVQFEELETEYAVDQFSTLFLDNKRLY